MAAEAESPVTSTAAARGERGDAVEQRGNLFHSWGPLLLLAVSSVVTFATVDLFAMSPAERVAVIPLTGVAVLLHLWWWRNGHVSRGPTAASSLHYGLRWAVAAVLTWLNPFYALYAIIGYFTAAKMLPGRWANAGLLATAVTMAGSQSGGLPPQGRVGWVVFGALLAVNISMVVIFTHLEVKDIERTRRHLATITELERTNARLQQALDENAALHAQLVVQAREAGVADERRRLAAEIHDTLAQGLIGIIAQLQAEAASTGAGTARPHLDRAAKLARQSLGEARRSVRNLSPAALEHDGLPQALRKTVRTWSEREGVRGEFTVTGTAQQLPDEVAATVLRIVQETLSNVARHARAARVGVTLSYMDGEITLDVRDDGRGFDPRAPLFRSGPGGFGLAGMRARAERVAGSLSVESEPGHGTAVSARVPLPRHDR
ncbi:sensor histidine kinase [Streptomyces sp. TP-A0874]|uniref:sensor histidine kinase n=1 Tax=Streptomyces sp. TP-A0874 TaxID=549819 RepID=UPI00099FAB9A|nr:sensor histidine kinase [Streptomyces sp. TP-A0874]